MTGHVLRPGYSRRDTLLANPFAGVDLDAFPEGAKSAVLHRDNHECQACGFASDRFCEIVAAVDPAFLAEDYVTLCRACWLFENLDRAAMLNAAAFIWAPELSQLEINRAAPILYTERLSKTSKARPAIENLLRLTALQTASGLSCNPRRETIERPKSPTSRDARATTVEITISNLI